mmetsp:Transcript_26242/g.26150  ORF Transcript_26242/g.26150 Transcript_26242/m.26150 type:complete len:170 (-) Transcript_26242:373-882(-)
MNIALPSNQEENKSSISKRPSLKRKRSDMDDLAKASNRREQLHQNIKNAFSNHMDDGNATNTRKRVKTTEIDEREYQINSNQKDGDNKSNEDKEERQRTLSISNFEPLQPRNKMLISESDKRNYRKGTVDQNLDVDNFDRNFIGDSTNPLRTPQPNRSDDMIINQLVYK